MRKKLLFFGFLMFILVILTSCDLTLDSKPRFYGVEDIVIEKGTPFLPLDGVSVKDKEDGDIDVSAVTVDASKVNVNVVGEYIVTYSVTDSYGNTITVKRKVTVVYTDTVPPVLFGVNDAEVFIGDPNFTPMINVSAEDNIDGDVTANITYTGEVNLWEEGEYQIAYQVSDEAGNVAEKTRTITVSLGEFSFIPVDEIEGVFDGKVVQVGETATVSRIPELYGGQVNQPHYFSFVKVVFKAGATVNKKVALSLTGATTSPDEIEITTEMQEYVKYFRITEPLEEAELTFTFEPGDATVTFETVKMYFAGFADEEAPVVEIEENKEVCVPVGAPLEVVLEELLRGVTAMDNLDGNLTSKLTVDFGEIDLDIPDTYTVNVTATDSFGNNGKLERTLIVARSYETEIIKDPYFDGETNTQFIQSTGGDGIINMSFVDGALVAEIVQAGNWGSANSPYISGLSTDKLEGGHWYLFKMDVKGTKERRLAIRAGLELWASPWIEDFGFREPKYWVRTEWTTIYYIFYVHASQSSVGSKNVKFEIHLGAIDYNANESDNTIMIDNAQFYKLTNYNEAPVITLVSGKPTTLIKGSPIPDFKTYFTATDLEDGAFEITDEMINIGDLDMNVPGQYPVTFTVTDSHGATTTETITINVIEQVDTTGPVITISPEALAMIEAMMPVKEGYDLTEFITLLAGYITVTDDVDGVIPFTPSMIDFGGLNYQNPQPGEYTVKISTKDSSGNDSNVLTLVITVSDESAPKLVGAINQKLFVGDTYNPLLGVKAYDNYDGVIDLKLENISGLEQFLDATGKVVNVGEFNVTYAVSDKAGNETTKTVLFTVEETAPDFYDGAYIDIIQKISWLSAGGSESTISYPNGQAVINYSPSSNWWASAVHIKCDGNINLVAGETFKLIIEADVELPRDILIYFVDGEGQKITGFDSESDYNKHRVGLVGGGHVYEYIFTIENTNVNGCTFEIDFGWEESLVNATAPQQITFKQFKLISTEGVLGSSDEELPETVILEDFEGFADNDAFQAATDDIVVGLRIGSGNFVKGNGTLLSVDGNKLIEQNIQYVGGSTCGIRIKMSPAAVPANIQYLVFYVRATTTEYINKFQAFVYNSDGNHTEISSSLIGSVSNLVEGTYVHIPVTALKSDTVQLSLVINIGGSASGQLYFDDILFSKELVTSFGYKMIEDFEGFENDEAFQAATDDPVVGFRIGTGSFVKINGQLVVEDDNKYVQQEFSFQNGSVSGIRFKIKKEDIPLGAKYIAIWVQADNLVNVNKFQAFEYRGSQFSEISSMVIGSINDLVEGTYIYIPVSALKDDTVEVSLQLNVNPDAQGILKFDNISLVKKFY
ncbi:MAG: DUF5011 domain-containing protein [Bacilli bacterium]|jgi:hypothetical protein|nr:DUF5011 domain-containing protein [Bacilli bacterium]HHU23862.1 DUF5011 domain-containing protein [Acholeplasmataceae bacterium]